MSYLLLLSLASLSLPFSHAAPLHSSALALRFRQTPRNKPPRHHDALLPHSPTRNLQQYTTTASFPSHFSLGSAAAAFTTTRQTSPTTSANATTTSALPSVGFRPYSPNCPTSCGLDAPVGTYFVPSQDDSSFSFLDVSSPQQCASICASSRQWNYYQWFSPSTVNGIPYQCSCYFGCYNSATDSQTPDTVFSGVAPLCSPSFSPACPVLEMSANSVLGVSLSDPSVVGPTSLQDSPLSCRDYCLNVSVATYFQWSGSATYASGFVYGICACLTYCPSSRFTSFSPITFYLGSLCATNPKPPACATPSNVLPPIPGKSGVTCTKGTTTTSKSGSSPLNVTQYACNLCNPANATSSIVDCQLEPLNFSPVSVSGITALGLVQGTICPGQCTRFSYSNPLALGAAQFFTAADPYSPSVLAVLPPSVGSGGNPTSPYQVSLGPCLMTGTVASSVGMQYSYSCHFANTAPMPIYSIFLSCPGFFPTATSGINLDCTITKPLSPGAVGSFRFQTVGPYFGPISVTSFTT